MSKKITYDEYKDKWDASFDKGKEYKAACNELGESSAKAKKLKFNPKKDIKEGFESGVKQNKNQ